MILILFRSRSSLYHLLYIVGRGFLARFCWVLKILKLLFIIVGRDVIVGGDFGNEVNNRGAKLVARDDEATAGAVLSVAGEAGESLNHFFVANLRNVVADPDFGGVVGVRLATNREGMATVAHHHHDMVVGGDDISVANIEAFGETVENLLAEGGVVAAENNGIVVRESLLFGEGRNAPKDAVAIHDTTVIGVEQFVDG